MSGIDVRLGDSAVAGFVATTSTSVRQSFENAIRDRDYISDVWHVAMDDYPCVGR
jgi:hypothetical protein